jgi:hypothetical protein
MDNTEPAFGVRGRGNKVTSPVVLPSTSVVCSGEDDVEAECAGPSSKFKPAAKDTCSQYVTLHGPI